MKNVRKILLLAILAIVTVVGSLTAFQVAALDNGLAKTPPMGWNSWNCFGSSIDETKIKQIADIMVSSGMRDAGYIYLNLDDNWMATSRDSSGNLRGDPTRFPSGMKALGDYIHSKGLKFGVYGDRGTKTCAGVNQSGGYGNEQRDANTYASWGVDYLKYDNCNAVGDMQTDYTNMKNALASCGRPIVFSICAWQFQSWMPATGNLWRVADDIVNTWDNGSSWGNGIIECIDKNAGLASYAKPGAWNDPDMLEIGNNGCTTEEYRTQMSMWCIMASPLIAGNDIRSMTQTTKDILLNTEAIAVDQDPAGIQGTRISASGGLEVWCKPLGSANGTTKAVALLNRNGSAANITVNFSSIGLSGNVTVRDLWAKADRGSFSGSYTMSVPSHGTGMLKLTSGIGPTSTPTPTPIPGTISIAAGSSSAVGSFQADQYYSGGSTYSNTNTVDVSQITSNPPPAALFNNERYGAMSYTFPGFTAGSLYTVTLYFAETYLTSSGSRLFSVSINGATALSNFDIYASAGGQNKAIARSFTATANSSGQIVIQFTAVTENPKINGISIKPGSGTPTPTSQSTPTPTGTPFPTVTTTQTPTPTRVGPTPTATPTPTGTVSISIAAGRTSALGSFQADQYYSGGSTYSNTNTVDVSQITSNPPPAALFNNERYGAMSYTIPGFTPGSSYTVTLYFAETYLTASGRRLFNVSLNGTTALSNFDIYASAGGQNKAIARSFTTTANSNGQIVIQFISGTENPKINGISIK